MTSKEAIGAVTPSWVTQEYFKSIVANEIENFSKITKFSVESGSPPGENYASIMLRILIEAELNDGSSQDLSLMMKTTHSLDTDAGKMVADMGIFAKENDIYDNFLPTFEKMYLEKGRKIVFGPKSFKLDKDPGVDTVVLEDLRPKKFKNANRLEGLDLDHTKSVLKKLAEYHAVSAVYYETIGPFPEIFNIGMLDPAKKDFYVPMYSGMMDVIKASFEKNVDNGKYYADKIFVDIGDMLDKTFEACRIKEEEFNVLNHGDSWSNNFMFKYNDKGEREETILVDFQICKYGTPAQDLLYFLFSSPNQEIRLREFDYFIKCYHDNLIENLILLEYPKTLPTLSSLHIAILRNHQWAIATIYSTLAIVLLEPTDNANMDNFWKADEEGTGFKNQVYSNPKYITCLNDILPWLDKRGMLE
ncbi:hypothetical protein ACFFRR_000786 [Megaselia abdita]